MEFKLDNTNVENYESNITNNNPKETSYNNKKSSDYFSSSVKSDNILIKVKNQKQNVIDSTKKNNHKKSSSQTYFILDNNKIKSNVETFNEKISTKKNSYKIPSKELEDSFDMKLIDMDEIITYDENKSNEIDKIFQFYDKIYKNFENFGTFAMKYKENFDNIEEWFDRSKELLQDDRELKPILNFKIIELITFGLVTNLYYIIRNESEFTYESNKLYYTMFINFKLCLESCYKNIVNIKLKSESVVNYSQAISQNNNIIINLLLQIIENLTETNEIGKKNIKHLKLFNNNNEKEYSTIHSELNTKKYIKYVLNNLEKIRFNDVFEIMYNDYLLATLVKINLAENKIINNSCFESESESDFLVSTSPLSQFYLPLIDKMYEYTLVLDLDETLVHFTEDSGEALVIVRPYAEFFLIEMSKYFEIVIFTAATEAYADLVLDNIDKNNSISHKLYKKHTTLHNNSLVKDLSKLGRNLQKTIIIDNVSQNFSLQEENGLQIISFLGDENDSILLELSSYLKSNLFLILDIVIEKVKDVRYALSDLRDILNL